MKNKITPAIIIVLVVAAIVYLEAIKVHPNSSGASQAINVSATSSPAVATAGGSVSSTLSLQSVAAADQAAGDKPAIEIADPTGFINASSDFTLGSLVGKNVILLDFWTYSCINCIRTVPYLTSWYQKYKNEGLVVVGIHTPEFDFEKDITNVQMAVNQYGITYPVVLDSNYGTWDAYGNLYWPHEYLIDIAGYIVHDQVGEGNYDETEAEIQKLLAQRAQVLGLPVPATQAITMPDQPNLAAYSPETYFGSNRNEYLGNGAQGVPGNQTFALPLAPAPNTLELGGPWNIQPEYAQSNGSDTIEYNYQAKGFYFVAGVASGTVPITVEVTSDGQPISQSVAGSDVFYKNGMSYVTIGENRLYRIVDAPSAAEHTIEITIPAAGLQAYTFTFG